MKIFELTEATALKIGNLIKRKREELGYSTNFIELHTGINKADLSRIENGKKKKINPIYLKELSKILKMNQIELFSMAGFIDEDYIKGDSKHISNVRNLSEDDFIEMPVKAKASAGNGYINFEDTLSTKLIRKGNFCSDCYLIEVAGNSMEPLIQDGAFVIVDPNQTAYIANKIFVVKVGDEVFIKRVLIKGEAGIMILKSINSEYEDLYITGKNLETVNLLGRAIKFVYEGNL